MNNDWAKTLQAVISNIDRRLAAVEKDAEQNKQLKQQLEQLTDRVRHMEYPEWED